MSKREENREEEMLSFDELKKQVTADEADFTEDAEVQQLLSSLRDIPAPDEAKTPDSEEENEAPTASEPPDEAQNYKSIYDDVLRAVSESKPAEEEVTGRRSKFLSGKGQFVDVTEHYQEYADLTPQSEEMPEAPAAQPSESEEEPRAAEPEKQYRTFNEIFKDTFLKIFPNRHDTVGEGIRKTVVNLSVLALAGCLVYFGIYGVQSYQASKQLADIKGQIIDDSTPSAENDVWAEFLSKYPNIRLPEGMMAKYAYLYAINQDLVGWIKIPNSLIDVQVVQAADNATYLKQDFYGNYSRYGCPCMDYRNDPKYLNKNTILYGHHMSDGLVFADLKKYKDIEGFQASPVIEFDTLYRSYRFKVYAAFITNSKESDDNGYIFNYTVTDFGSNDKFMEYMAAVDERKLYSTGVDVQPDDKIITLQTCTYEFSDARLVVVGRLLRENESTSIDTSLAVANENPRYPQAWYDKNGKTNPFAEAPKWTIGAGTTDVIADDATAGA